MKELYLDNAATTKPYPEVITSMVECYEKYYYNPSSIYTKSAEAHALLDDCKTRIKNVICGDDDGDIIITSGGSEADNLAIKGTAQISEIKKYYSPGHIITTAIEHKAVLKSCEYLEDFGISVTYLEPDERGIVTPLQVEDAIREDTFLVSIMAANNEIGTIEPLEEIGNVCEKHGILFHVDAVQGVGHMDVNAKKWKADMISASAHKFHGPKGIGFLYVDKAAKDSLFPIIHGGKQEYGLRAGTENLPSIVGMTVAIEKATENLYDKIDSMEQVRDYMIEKIINGFSGVKFNGSFISRLCNNVNFSFEGISGSQAQALLDQNGIMCSTGSACNSGDAVPSHVLTAIGCTQDESVGALRFTISEETTKEDIDYFIKILSESIDLLRR